MRKNRTGYKLKKIPQDHSSLDWLPIDSRLIPDIFAFGQVKGVARIFLLVEIVLSVLVVSVSISLFALRILKIY